MGSLAVLHASLATMAGEGVGLIEDGGFVSLDGIIRGVGPTRDLQIPSDAEVVDAGGKVVTPGLVDAHTHLVFGGNRIDELEMRSAGKSYEEIAAAGGGILSTVRATRALDEDELFEASLSHALEMLSWGTTTAEVKSGYGLDVETELKMLRVVPRLAEATGMRLVPTFFGAHAVPPEFSGRKDKYVDYIVQDMLPKCAPHAAFADVFVESIAFDREDARRICDAAMRFGLGIRLHADQLADSGGAALAAEIGADSADHLEHTGPAGIAALASAGSTAPVLLPGSVVGLGKAKQADAQAMLEAGLRVVLASDFNPGSSPTPSLPWTMSIAARAIGMSPTSCLMACTVNAAKSLRLSCGQIKISERADFAIWPFRDWRELVYWMPCPKPESVFLKGRRSV